MRTPAEIQELRASYESKLEALDAEDQAWEELSRIQKLTELGHKANCSLSHAGYNDSCKYYDGNWTSSTMTMQKWMRKIEGLVAELPDADDEQILKVLRIAS